MWKPGAGSAIELLRLAALGHDERNDAQLLAALIHSRDTQAVDAIVRRHGPMVWGVCRRALSHHDAEDAFQATFLVLVRRANAVRPPEMLGNWLYGVARRTALKAKAMASKRTARETAMVSLPEPESAEPADWTDLRPILDRELERLPDKYRAPVILCDLEGKTRQEAARRLGWPTGTLCSRLFAGRKKLRARLARRGLALSGGLLTVTLVEQAAAHVSSDLLKATVALICNPRPPASAAVLLAQKVVRAMSIGKLKLTALVLVAAGLFGGSALLVPASGGGGGAPAKDPPPSRDTSAKPDLVLKGHSGGIFGLAFSADGTRLATASADRTAKVWDLQTGKEITTLKGGDLPVLSVAFEPDGRGIITAASEIDGGRDAKPGEVWRWNPENGEVTMKLTGHKLPTFAVAVSPDGTRAIAVGGAGGQGEVSAWDLKTGKLLFQVQTNSVSPLMAIDFSPDGKFIVVGGGKEVRAIDARVGKELFKTAEHPDPVYATVISPDGVHIASAGVGKPPGIRLWDANTGRKLPMIETTQRSIKSLAYSRDGAKLASGGFDGTARIFDVATGSELAVAKYDKNVNAVAFDRSGARLAVAGDDHLVHLYSVKILESAPKPAARSEPLRDPKGDTSDARKISQLFLTAAAGGKIEEARSYADHNHISEDKVKDFQQAGFKRVDISTTLAGDTDALTISEPVELAKEGKGHVLVYLRKKDGQWKVRDIDFEASEKALRKQRDFLESHPEAKAVKAAK
jgi:RNA polymerase sigma factor (sigma-70 family)